jgi:hypothetical protein
MLKIDCIFIAESVKNAGFSLTSSYPSSFLKENFVKESALVDAMISDGFNKNSEDYSVFYLESCMEIPAISSPGFFQCTLMDKSVALSINSNNISIVNQDTESIM